MKNKFILVALLLLTFVLSGCGGGKTDGGNSGGAETNPPAEAKPVSEDLKITMLNVGQGDAFLIQTKSQNILIDTSDQDERSKLVSELDKAGVTTFDKIILTHPHADHIGGVEKILKDSKYTVKEVYDNGIAATGKLYLNYMKLIKDSKGKIKHGTLVTGDVLDFGDGASFEVLAPDKATVKAVNSGKQKTDPNNESIVGRLVYKDFNMMFTGDAEIDEEVSILSASKDNLQNLKSRVLKSGHHGSRTSLNPSNASSVDFLRLMNPQYVVISAGEPTDKRGGNTYGHPHPEPLEAYLNNGIASKNIFWTWKNGTVTIVTDGKNVSVTPEIEEDWVEEWIAQKK
ncbi:MAG: MBL fold metallo-hydrolase [Selenomonadaceae bacterium]|nr:MBL fold metallo-hydrolase [Selenomonadaceae bacterium]